LSKERQELQKTKIEQVNQLMKQFDQMSKMMKMMARRKTLMMMGEMKGGMPRNARMK
jgi:signal recognition particle subunit SRP54